eukprot:TRINITY_DN17370_c0_g2_i1.p1 TRINITY_DN17370_c0_g2~~TRINITY_DN17370_c0_g2_i1.p1  ORF type:complete len:363 (-),score=94.81 TRINITY_DN17370_c0_g2_i1:50-1138(-)
MQSLEEMRMQAVKSSALRFAEYVSTLSEKYFEISECISESSKVLNVNFEIQNFVRKCLAARTTEVPFKPYKYDLEMSLDQIREKTETNDSLIEERLSLMPPGREPVYFFGMSIEDMMKAQTRQFPDQDVPIAFLFSLKLLHKMRGTEVEGIFRISCDVGEVLLLRESLQFGNIPGLPSTPHVAAVLLKKWLLELENPLIPADMYDQCLFVGKMESPGENLLEDIVNNLPSVNAMILRELIALWKDVSNPLKVTRTKMTPFNLAVVFSPTILRCPDQDPIKQLQNTPFETHFVEHLISTLPEEYAEYQLLDTELPEVYAIPTSSGVASSPVGPSSAPALASSASVGSAPSTSNRLMPDFLKKS